jgi:ribosomal-protein-alanine N-acetyltransferase
VARHHGAPALKILRSGHVLEGKQDKDKDRGRARRGHVPVAGEISPMRAADLDEVLEIERLSHPAPWSRQVFIDELAREWAHLVVLRQPGVAMGVAAFCNYWLVRDEIHILNVACHPDHRRQGHAARLLAHVIGQSDRHACRSITLEVRRKNQTAIRLYRRHGFVPIGLRHGYYANDGEDAVVMLLHRQGEP